MIDFACPTCGREMHVPDSAAGKTGQCKGCGNSVKVPSPAVDIVSQAASTRPSTKRPAPPPVVEDDDDADVASASRRPSKPVVTTQAAPQSGAAMGLGIASIVVGGIGLLICLVPLIGIIGIPVALLGMLLAAIAVVVSMLHNGSNLMYGATGGGISIFAIFLCLVVNFIFSGQLSVMAEASRRAAEKNKARAAAEAQNDVQPPDDNRDR